MSAREKKAHIEPLDHDQVSFDSKSNSAYS